MLPAVVARIIARKSMTNPALMSRAPGPWIAVGLIEIASFIIADAMLIVAISDGYLKGEVDLARAFRAGARRIFAVTAVSCIRGLWVVGIGIACSVPFAILLLAKVPAAPFLLAPMVMLFAAYPLLRTFAATVIVMLEGAGARAAINRSSRLSKDCVAHIFVSLGLSLLLYFAISGITAALSLKLLAPATAGIVRSLVIIPIYPFFAIVSTLLYYDLRIRKEGFDLEVTLRELGTNAAA